MCAALSWPSYFNPLSPHGERPALRAARVGAGLFQSTLPAWGETEKRRRGGAVRAISIHSPRMGRDPLRGPGQRPMRRFQSTLPAWGETINAHTSPTKGQYFNPLSPHGERLVRDIWHGNTPFISIHSPRMGRDSRGGEDMMEELISIHSPRMGRDFDPSHMTYKCIAFQSTLPAWGETGRAAHRRPDRRISIHSPRMGRDLPFPGNAILFSISIHSPRMGRDLPFPGNAILFSISIHSPRMGRDSSFKCKHLFSINFNPLSPHGERHGVLCSSRHVADFNPLSPHGKRHQWHTVICVVNRFQSTLPAWGETQLFPPPS